MVVPTKAVQVEEAVQAPLITDWPLRMDPPPSIEPWPVREKISLAERARRLVEDPRAFRDWLLARGKDVVGHSFDGKRCPFSQFVLSELEVRWARGVSVNIQRTGLLHECAFRQCDHYPHIEHPEWLRAFIEGVDTGAKLRSVSGTRAVAILDRAIAKSAVRAGA